MFRKAGHIAIIFIQLVSTTGITVSKHCSMGGLFDVSFLGEADRCCDGPCNCCQDEVEYHRLLVDFVAMDIQEIPDEAPGIDLLISIDLFIPEYSEASLFTAYPIAVNHPPPKDLAEAVFTQSFLL